MLKLVTGCFNIINCIDLKMTYNLTGSY